MTIAKQGTPLGTEPARMNDPSQVSYQDLWAYLVDEYYRFRLLDAPRRGPWACHLWWVMHPRWLHPCLNAEVMNMSYRMYQEQRKSPEWLLTGIPVLEGMKFGEPKLTRDPASLSKGPYLHARPLTLRELMSR